MSKLIIANWKSNKSREEVTRWIDDYDAVAERVAASGNTVVIAPPTPSLMFVSNRLLDHQKHPTTFLGVQVISPYPAGQYTGAISTHNLEGFQVKYAIVGHSERRRHFHESHQDAANKVLQCIEAGIKPIVCVDDEYIADQAAAIGREYLNQCVVAYEELGAIGTGQNEPVAHVAEIVKRIKIVFGDIPVLYGGSVSPANAAEYGIICSGVLVGGASLKVESFVDIITQLR